MAAYSPYKPETNSTEVLDAAETAVSLRAQEAAEKEALRLQQQRDRKAAIRAKGLTSLPGARKAGFDHTSGAAAATMDASELALPFTTQSHGTRPAAVPRIGQTPLAGTTNKAVDWSQNVG